MAKLVYYKVCKFKLDGNTYQLFKTQNGQKAYLKINNGKYEYPSLLEFSNILKFVEGEHNNSIYSFSNGLKKHNKVIFEPKLKNVVNNKLTLIMITSSLVLSTLTGCGYQDKTIEDAYIYSGEDIEVSYDVAPLSSNEIDYSDRFTDTEDLFAYHDTNGFVETEDYSLLNSGSPKSLKLFNNKYFKDFFGVSNYSISEVLNVLNNNKYISDKYKEHIKDFIIDMNNYYPDLDWRVFVYNLSTLKIEEMDPDEGEFLLSSTLAFYDDEENSLVVKSDIDFNDEFSYVILRHELGHLFNCLKLVNDEYKVKYSFKDAGEGKFIQEAMDVIFTTEPYKDTYSETTKRNMGYPITTNIVRVMVDSMNKLDESYKIEDSITHNIYYFEDKLREVMPDDIDPVVIDTILEYQWMEYDSDKIEVDDEDYKDLYQYVTRLYIKANINKDMSYSEIEDAAIYLKDELIKGVKNPNYVYIDAIDEVFNNYLEENNIVSYTK